MSKKLIAFIIGAVIGVLLGWGFIHFWPQLLIAAFLIAIGGFIGCVFLNNADLFDKAKSKLQ